MWLIIRSLHMTFEFNMANGLWENYVLIHCWDSNMSNLGWKVNIDLWNLFITMASLGFNIWSKNKDFGFNSNKKINVSKKKNPI